MNRLLSTFKSLKYRNFRLFFPGLIVSQIGIWIQNIAIGWLVYDMTRSAFMMGFIMFCNAIPLFLLTPFVGVFIDKLNKHKLLMSIQILFASQALIISVLTFCGLLRIWNIIILGLFLNVIAAIDLPLRQSIFVHLVDDKKDLGNAISLNSTCFNLARLVGPAIAGILVASVGVGVCFFINFICFIPAIILVSRMNIIVKNNLIVQNETIFESLKEGFSYIKHNKKIILLLIFLAIFSFIGLTYPMLMPIYTKEVFHANADVLGLLMAMAGVGALIGSLLIASKTTTSGLKYILCSGAFVFSISLLILGFSNSLYFSVFAMFILGMGMTSCITCDNTLLQMIIDDDKRGRVMSIHSICFLGTTSISNLFAGTVAQHIGISNTFIVFGVFLLFVSIIFFNLFKKLSF